MKTCLVLPGGTIQLATTAGNTSQGVGDGQSVPTLTMTNTPAGGAIVQYAQTGQDGQFFVPGWLSPSYNVLNIIPIRLPPETKPLSVFVSSLFYFFFLNLQ